MISDGNLAEESGQLGSGETDELRETLWALLLERRLFEFADALDGSDRLIFRRRMLASSPASIRSLADALGVSYRHAAARARALETRLKHALQDPS